MNHVFIANRGDCLLRIARTLKKLNKKVSTLGPPTAHERLSQLIDVWIQPSKPGRETYLSSDIIIACAKKAGADAIHPGWGFLSEDASFAQAVLDAGLIFIGPTPTHLAKMGDKAEAKAFVKQSGLPVLETFNFQSKRDTIDTFTATLKKATPAFPLIVKPVLGGGGKGMQVIERVQDIAHAIKQSQSLSEKLFASGDLIVEPYIKNARHIEVQLISDQHGTHVHAFERDCSIQRSNQKLIEEAPSLFISDDLRQKLTQATLTLAEALQYQSLGTVEFLVDASEQFYFMEMNTRLQVEHGVTEALLNIDLVELQIAIAEGASLANQVALELPRNRHVIEMRLCAERPEADFMPAPGTFYHVQLPEGARIEGAVSPMQTVDIDYDSMFLKLIVSSESRPTAIATCKNVLRQCCFLGVENNIELLQWILSHPDFAGAEHHTQWLTGEAIYQSFLDAHKNNRALKMPQLKKTYEKALAQPEIAQPLWQISPITDARSVLYLDQAVFVQNQKNIYAWQNGEHAVWQAHFSEGLERATSDGSIRAPMTGLIKSIEVQPKQKVHQNDTVLILEAMKMEYKLLADQAGEVVLKCKEGELVHIDTVVFEILPSKDKARS